MRANHRDNAAKVIAEISRASGMAFSRPDRLSRQEAEAVLKWGEKHPQVVEAYTDPKHPAHDEIMSYAAWGFYFSAEHPADEAGQPREWSAVRTVDDDAADDAKLDDDFDPFANWTPQQARARLAAAMNDPKYREFREAYQDPHHADHALAMAEFGRLRDIEAGVDAASPSAGGTPIAGAQPSVPGEQAAALKHIDDLYADPEFLKRSSSPDRNVRDAATAQAAALFARAYPELPAAEVAGGAASPGATGGRAAGSAPSGATAQQKIDRLFADAEFMGRYQSQNPEVRDAATAEMSAAFEAAYPEAPPAPEGDGGAAA
jgi:hypothetical protein